MTKRVFFLTVMAIIGTAIAVVWSAWTRATQLPDWYAQQSDAGGGVDLNPEATAQFQSKMAQLQTGQAANGSAVDGNPVEVSINEQELNALLTAVMTKSERASTLTSAIKEMRTTVRDDKIESGAVVDFNSLSVDQLNGREQTAIAAALRTFPFLKDQQIYIGIEGKPTIQNGRIQLDENLKVKVGNLSLTLSELSNRLGVPLSRLEQRLNDQLALSDLDISEIDLTDRTVRLRGATGNPVK